jgi:creatinine amidohydrolase
MAFPGTVTFSEETLLGVLLDTIESFSHHGIKRIVLINYHGGNENVMNLATQLAKRRFKIMVATPHGPNETETAKKIRDRMQRYFEVHSGPRETAFALHYFPELVEMWRLDNWKNGVIVSKQLREFMDPDRKDHELVY